MPEYLHLGGVLNIVEIYYKLTGGFPPVFRFPILASYKHTHCHKSVIEIPKKEIPCHVSSLHKVCEESST